MNEGIGALRELARQGWAFDYPRDDNGDIVRGLGARFYPPSDWWDGLRFSGPDECEAIRVRGDEITWKRYGAVLDVVHAVAELPAPGDRLAPRLASGWRLRHGLWRTAG
jgi:hypothetical protein